MAFLLRSCATQNRRRRYHRAMSHVEMLESRTLMSATLTQLPDNFTGLSGTYDNNDNLWVLNLGIPSDGNGGPTIARVANGAVQESYAIPDINGSLSPSSIVNGGNGHLYVTDFNGAIDDFDLSTHSWSQYTYDVGPNFELADSAGYTTVTSDGGLWIVGLGGSDPNAPDQNRSRTDYVGRFDINTHEFKYTLLNDFNPAVGEDMPLGISVKDDHSVYVGLQGLHGQDADFNWITGVTRLATISFDSSSDQVVTTGIYSINTGDATTDQWGILTGVAADTDGSVWISIGNSDQGQTDPFRAPAYPVDQLVNMKINPDTNQLDHLATVYLSDSSSPRFVGDIELDSQGRLWYAEQAGTHLGYFDTFAGTVTTIDYPAGTPRPLRLFSNHAGTETTMLTDDGDQSDGYPMLQVTVAAPEVQFSGTAFNQSGAENIANTNILLATFTAPEDTYTANITWGDGTTASVSTVDLGDNLYGIIVSSKTFADQGTYAGSISIVNASAVEVGTLTFSSVISDTPLTITQMSVVNPNGHFANLQLTFTDDIDSQASWFMASVNWGDNSTSAGIVVKDTTTPGQYFVIASHKYKKKGTYLVNASVTTSELDVTVTTATASATILI